MPSTTWSARSSARSSGSVGSVALAKAAFTGAKTVYTALSEKSPWNPAALSAATNSESSGWACSTSHRSPADSGGGASVVGGAVDGGSVVGTVVVGGGGAVVAAPVVTPRW